MSAGTALDAEMIVSALIGSWWRPEMIDADPEVEFGEGLVAYAARRRSEHALALLRVFAELGTPAQRSAGATGAEALAASGAPDPPWVADLGSARFTGSWAYGDVYGDQTSVLATFDGAGEPHGVMVLVDHTLGDVAKDAFLVEDPARVREEARAAFGDDTAWTRELDATETAALLRPALETTDVPDEARTSETFRDTRALALARLRLLPEPEPVVPAPAGDPEAVADTFLASPARPSGLDTDAVASSARFLARELADIDGKPDRISPAKLALLLERPDVLDALAGEDAALPEVLRAWVGWAGARQGLPEAARKELAEVADEILDPVAALPEEFVGALVDDAPDGAPEELADLAARRLFALGGPTAVVDGEEMEIDPTDPDERALAIRAEHPEYEHVLDDDTLGDEVLVDGVNPRLHLAMHEMVANQLWDGDPPEAWPAAQRLLTAGMDRHDVLHALAEVATRQVHAAVVERRPYDAAAYAADLDALGADRS